MSIRLRLFLILTLATSAIWLSAVIWINGSTRAQVERVLDARLAEAANMVSSLISNQQIAVAGAAATMIPMPSGKDYARQLSCQIWSLRGDLVGASSGAPDVRLATEDGYSTSLIDGVPWRVYAVHNDDLGVRVMVGDQMQVRDRLVGGVVAGLLWPVAVVFPVLALLIWISVGRGLAPLVQLESALRARSPDDLSPLPDIRDSREIRPVRRALNSLFARLDHVRRTERDFTTFAAHELKTPLAGLRMQAQIAQRAPDPATRNRALTAIATSVDRSDRMVRQLLDLAAIDHEAALAEPLDPTALMAEIAQGADQQAASARVHLVTAGRDLPALHVPRVLIHSALRNLVENAIQHSPPGGRITLTATAGQGTIRFTVTDQGPGIPPEDHARVTERFWRGDRTTSQGSGLGLSITASAVTRMGGSLHLGQPDHGQSIWIDLPMVRPGP